MAHSQTRSIADVAKELFAEQWVKALFADLAQRQEGSLRISANIRAKSAANHTHWPFHSPHFPLAVREASGSQLIDVDGNRYLDCHLGFGSQALHGHAPPDVVAFVQANMTTSPGNGYLSEVEKDLVDLLHEFMPHCEKFAFLNSGTDATAAAIRLCRAHTGRRRVAKFEGSVHGVHDIAAHNTAFWYHGHPARPFPAVTGDGVQHLPAFTGVPVADDRDLLVLPYNFPAAYALIERHRNELACVIAEAVSSSFPFEQNSVPLTRETALVCRALGVPFVLDEVLTGFRCGPGGAAERYGIPADLYTYGKVLSGLGVPLSAVGGRADLLDQMQTAGQPQLDFGRKTCVQTTHAGNHLALCASLASLRLLREQGDDYYVRVRANVARLGDRLSVFRANTGIPLRLTGFADFIGSFSFLANRSYLDYREFTAAINPLGVLFITLMLRQRGIYMLSAPMIFTGGAHTAADMDELYAAVADSALALQRHGFPFVLDRDGSQ